MTRQSHPTQVHTVDLGHEQMLILDDRRGARIDVLQGGVWLTEERNWHDRFGAAGEWLRLETAGRTIVEAIGPTRIQVAEPQPPLRTWWQRLTGSGGHRLQAAHAAAAAMALVAGLGLPELLGRGFQAGAWSAQVQAVQQSVAPVPQPGAGVPAKAQGTASNRDTKPVEALG